MLRILHSALDARDLTIIYLQLADTMRIHNVFN